VPVVSELTHVGLHCYDVEVMRSFYTRVLGLKVSDAIPGTRAYLSAQPAYEHHELVLMPGRSVTEGTQALQQLSFRVHQLQEVLDFYRVLVDEGVTIHGAANHGNAIGIYFLDPEGNTVEVYWATGLVVSQPYLARIDLTGTVESTLDELRAQLRDHPDHYVDSTVLAAPEKN